MVLNLCDLPHIYTVVKNLTDFSSTTNKINRISNHFLEIWICSKLRETERTSKLNIKSLKINVNDIVLVFYEKLPRHFWRILMVTRVSPSKDSETRGAIMRIAKTNTFFKRPVNEVFAIENTYHDTNQTD